MSEAVERPVGSSSNTVRLVLALLFAAGVVAFRYFGVLQNTESDVNLEQYIYLRYLGAIVFTLAGSMLFAEFAFADTSSKDKFFIAAALFVLIAGMFGYYYFVSPWQMPWQLYLGAPIMVPAPLTAFACMLGGAISSALLFVQSQPGKDLVAFGRLSFREMKKVVWPTPNEAFQTTLVVLGFCILMGGFFWLVDISVVTLINFINNLGS